MNDQLNKTPEASVAVRPPVITTVIFAVIAAGAAALVPEFGFISILAVSAGVIYITSARAPFAVLMIPVVGMIAAVERGEVFSAGAIIAVALASFLSGWILRRGGDFHRALMAFTFVTLAVSVIGFAVAMRIAGITVEELSAAYAHSVRYYASAAISSLGDRITPEAAAAMMEQYEAFAATSLIITPAVIAWTFEACGIIAIRLTGWLHDVTGSTLYSEDRRPAAVSRTFAVIFLVSLVIGSVDESVVGLCAANIMMVLMLPSAAAGVSAYRQLMRQRKRAGRRGIPGSLMLLVIVFLLINPMTGLMLLAMTGSFAAFMRKHKPE